jgi:hypothetical protein
MPIQKILLKKLKEKMLQQARIYVKTNGGISP